MGRSGREGRSRGGGLEEGWTEGGMSGCENEGGGGSGER
jgi:hypothetical protein